MAIQNLPQLCPPFFLLWPLINSVPFKVYHSSIIIQNALSCCKKSVKIFYYNWLVTPTKFIGRIIYAPFPRYFST